MINSVEYKLRKALAEEAEKNSEKTYVSTLCEKAKVSRASFYLYYTDLEDFINKTREYIIDKLYEQLLVIMNIHPTQKGRAKIVLDEVDLKLLKAYTAKNVYWDFAVTANKILTPKFKALMIERWGEEFFEEKKHIFEFLLNGGIASLYFDLTNYNKETYLKNMDRIGSITKELLELDKLPCEN